MSRLPRTTGDPPRRRARNHRCTPRPVPLRRTRPSSASRIDCPRRSAGRTCYSRGTRDHGFPRRLRVVSQGDSAACGPTRSGPARPAARRPTSPRAAPRRSRARRVSATAGTAGGRYERRPTPHPEPVRLRRRWSPARRRRRERRYHGASRTAATAARAVEHRVVWCAGTGRAWLRALTCPASGSGGDGSTRRRRRPTGRSVTDGHGRQLQRFD